MADPRSEIETAFSRLQMCRALAQNSDRLVANAIDWYTCVKPNLSPRKVRQQPKLIRQAVGDYLYIAGCNLAVVMENLPKHCNLDLIAQVAGEQVSKLVNQRYPDLSDAMNRAARRQRPDRPGTKTNFATYRKNAQDAIGDEWDVTREIALDGVHQHH